MPMEDTIRAYLQGRIGRREFVKALTAVGVTVGAATSYAEVLGSTRGVAMAAGASQAVELASPVALSSKQYALLQAIAGRILPTTDTPGAIEAGAADYVDQALADAYQPLLARYQRALDALDDHALSVHGQAFAALSEAQQDALLTDLEAGRVATVEEGREFFALVRRHVLEGVFCEPYYGGNRDLVGWRLVNFPGQRYGYADPYINRVVDLPPVASVGPPVREG